MGGVVTSESLADLKVSALTWNAGDVDPIPTLGTIFPIFIIRMILVTVTTMITVVVCTGRKAKNYTDR